MSENKPCPICGLNAPMGYASNTDSVIVRCERCGEYRLTSTLLSDLRSEVGALQPYLSAHTRQNSEAGNFVTLTTANWRKAAEAHAHTPVKRKMERFLEYASEHSTSVGQGPPLKADLDYPLIDAASGDEMLALWRHLAEVGYLQPRWDYAILTVRGWERMESPERATGIPGRCFVAMSFDEDLDDIYFDAIKAAIEQDCGKTAVRLKELQHNDDISDRMLSEIRQAEFMVADFTKANRGVYYEAGFGRALGRPVIMTCRDSDFEKLHFDTNHLNHIKWSNAADFRQKLIDRIRVTIIDR